MLLKLGLIEEIIIDPIEIKRIVKEYYEQMCFNKLDNLGEKKKVLQRYNLPKMTQKQIENLNKQQ